MIEIQHLCKSFDKLQVLSDITLHINKGEVVSIVGPSGAGKTTLLQIVGTLDRPDSGRLLIGGEDVLRLGRRRLATFRGRHIGFVFQFHQLLPEFTAIENIMMPALIAGKSKSAARRRATELLEFMKLTDRATHKPAQLSGGEKQRIAVARALMNEPDVVLADEPSGSLDSHNKAELHQLFFDLRDQYGQTFVIVTHDEELATITDRTIHLADGRIVGETSREQQAHEGEESASAAPASSESISDELVSNELVSNELVSNESIQSIQSKESIQSKASEEASEETPQEPSAPND